MLLAAITVMEWRDGIEMTSVEWHNNRIRSDRKKRRSSFLVAPLSASGDAGRYAS